MIKDFFIKKENILILVVACISIVAIVAGFLFLFFDINSKKGPRTIPNTVEDIVWATFSSKLFDNKIIYPEYLYVSEQKESNGVGINMFEFFSKEFLTYFSNQNHFSIYPDGIDNQLFYGKTKQSEYTSTTGQIFTRVEYLTTDNRTWGIMLIPKTPPKGWQPRGFIWFQSAIKNKQSMCVSSKGLLIDHVTCDPYAGELPIYKGEISDDFLRFGYEIINKNIF